MPGAVDPRHVIARKVLFDALDALGEHRASIVLIGAQAVYIHTGDAELQTTPYTDDADLALDPRLLDEDPRIEACMTGAGFVLGENPGNWRGPHDTHVDLIVPQSMSGKPGRRGARIPPHSTSAARQSPGIEACVVDMSAMTLQALDPEDRRTHEVRVAGPAALMVAKAHKIGERSAQSQDRVNAKDALDMFRLLRRPGPDVLAVKLGELMNDPAAGATTRKSIEYMNVLFATANADGPSLVAAALEDVDQPELGQEASFQLMQVLLTKLRESQ